jgi:hypothetical protein
MPRRPSFEVSASSSGTFLVHVPASLSLLGKLERRTFKQRADAEKYAGKLRTQYHKGVRGGVVDPATARESSAAETILKAAGIDVSVAEAVRAYAEARKVLDPHGATIGELVKEWAARRKARGDDRTFEEAAAAFVTAKEMDWSARYVRNIEQTRKALPDWFVNMRLPDIDDETILRAVRVSVSTPTAIETRMRHVKSLCSGKGKKGKRKAPVILSVSQCAVMLRACITPEERRCVALLLFAGIRPDSSDGEITKLDWSAVRATEIYVSAYVSKTETDRIIPIRPRLARLIKGHPAKGPVMPPGWAKRVQAIRRAAGMSDPKFQDATRHAFASHHLVAYGETSTQAAMGHTEGSRTLFKFYRSALTEAAGTKYFR